MSAPKPLRHPPAKSRNLRASASHACRAAIQVRNITVAQELPKRSNLALTAQVRYPLTPQAEVWQSGLMQQF